MKSVKVLRSFTDLEARRDRQKGEVFVATDDRAAHIASVLPYHVEVSDAPDVPEEGKAKPTDYHKMTNPQLAGLLRERGINPPKHAKKAELIALLEG